jgi:hypothetical protein
VCFEHTFSFIGNKDLWGKLLPTRPRPNTHGSSALKSNPNLLVSCSFAHKLGATCTIVLVHSCVEYSHCNALRTIKSISTALISLYNDITLVSRCTIQSLFTSLLLEHILTWAFEYKLVLQVPSLLLFTALETCLYRNHLKPRSWSHIITYLANQFFKWLFYYFYLLSYTLIIRT